jgi:hypothetical protein
VRVVIVALRGGNRRSGLDLHRAYQVHDGPDRRGRVLVFDDHHGSFRWVRSGEYREVPDPLERHDLARIQQTSGGWRPVCSCVWRWQHTWADPDAAAHTHRVHQRHMAAQRRLLTQPAPPPLGWDAQPRHREEPER